MGDTWPGLQWSTAMGDGEETPTPGSPESGVPLVQGGNPAWNDVLQYIPEDKRPEVVPKLQEWDQSFQQVQQQTAPWKEFIEGGVEPDTARLALNVLQTIENNPRQAYDIIGKHLGISTQEAKEVVEDYQQQQQEAAQQQQQGSAISAEEFQNLKRQTDTMAQLLIARRQEEEIAEQEAQLDQELSSLKKTHGEFPENEVVMRMLHSDMTAEEALKDYYKFEEELFKNRRSAPRVFSGGGQIPQPKIDPRKLDGKGTRDLVTQMIEDSIQQGG